MIRRGNVRRAIQLAQWVARTTAVLALLAGSASAFASGSPVCGVDGNFSNIQISHPMNLVFGPGPYVFSTDVAGFTPGEAVTVTLSGSTFHGVLLEAVDDQGNRVGDWTPGVGLKTVAACGSEAITHTSPAARASVVATWNPPPSTSLEGVTFEAYVFRVGPAGPLSAELYRLVVGDGGLDLPQATPVPSLGLPAGLLLIGTLLGVTAWTWIGRKGVFLALALLWTVGGSLESEASIGFAVGDDAPDFTLVDQYGSTRTLLGDFVGGDELVILDFCALWCAPCQIATQESGDLIVQLANEGIDVHYVQLLVQDSIGNPADQSHATLWSNTFGNPEPVLTGVETESQYEGYATETGAFAFPTFAFVTPEGLVQDVFAGYTSEALRSRAYTWDSDVNGYPSAASMMDLEVFAGTASGSLTLLPDGLFQPVGGSHPGEIFASWNSTGMSTLRVEDWELSIFGATPLPQVEPFTLVVDEIDWVDLPGGPDPGRDFEHGLVAAEAQLRVYDENVDLVGILTIPVSLTATTLTVEVGALEDSLGQPGFPPAPMDVFGFEIVDLAIKATPVPEPSISLGLLAGGGLLMRIGRRK